MNAHSAPGTAAAETEGGRVDAERLQGTKDRNIAWATGEQGAESTSVVITNKQLSLLGAKQPLHILT